MEEFYTFVELLDEFLGKPKKIYESKSQLSYNCPICDDEKNKGNLEINLDKMVFHCWSCGDTEDMRGTLTKLFDKFASKKQKKLFKLLKPDEKISKEKKQVKVKLPESFVFFKDSNPKYPIRNQAYNYLKSRGITDEIIEKYKIGFCDKGTHSGRIVIPSFNVNGELNYYIARSWNPTTKFKYKNPDSEKDKIIFNENLINWEQDITLVEGAFDSVFVPNSIPMLGKHLSLLLFETLYKKAKKNIIVATDGDAWEAGVKIFNELNGGELFGRIKIVKLPKDKDICDVKGKIDDFFVKMK